MTAKVCVASLLLVLVCVGVGLFAQGPTTGQTAPPFVLKLPDLLVKQVTIARTGGGEFPTHEFTIVIKNKGTGNAGGTTLGVLNVDNVTAGPTGAGVYATVATPAILAGAQATVKFTRQMFIDKAYWVFVADAPVAGKPLGRLIEAGGRTKGKCNNSFVVAYDIANGNPQIYTNPAAM